ncbi:hypothetical protein K504DRAFT_116408 [Pleomassaria siparia CBS 279.74]|uniref:Uncharacterized protein n=1 Tax=Pleomassaria siparia CBS 279.74 TaxID=1314801 RepID=A0A6G1JV18_9PLEO|nr:hypothetical protein K504DRAFT_116408 [Pleomassaria siparia CBS 279.74]
MIAYLQYISRALCIQRNGEMAKEYLSSTISGIRLSLLFLGSSALTALFFTDLPWTFYSAFCSINSSTDLAPKPAVQYIRRLVFRARHISCVHLEPDSHLHFRVQKLRSIHGVCSQFPALSKDLD